MYYWIKNGLSNKKKILEIEKNGRVSRFIIFFTTLCLTHIKTMEMEKFKDNLIHLRVIIEEIEKININERLETKKKKKK